MEPHEGRREKAGKGRARTRVVSDRVIQHKLVESDPKFNSNSSENAGRV